MWLKQVLNIISESVFSTLYHEREMKFMSQMRRTAQRDTGIQLTFVKNWLKKKRKEIWKINLPQFCGGNFFSYICGGDEPLWGCYTISLFHFFRNSQHSEKWSISFKNFFRKCECIRSCYLPIFSNLLRKSLRKTIWAFTYRFVQVCITVCYHTAWMG